MIEQQLAGNAVVRQSMELPDRTNGEMREVDVVIEVKCGRHTARIGLEAITGRAHTPWVESMLAKHQLGHLTDKLVLVAGRGFSKPARDKAKAFGVETLTLDEAAGTDWPAAIAASERLWFARLDLTPQEISVTLHSRPDGRPLAEVGPETTVVSADGSRRATLLQLVRQFIDAKSPLRDVYAQEDREKLSHFEIDGTPDEECFILDSAGERHRLLRLHVSGVLRFAMAEVAMRKGEYGDTAVAWGEGEIGGQKLVVAGIAEPGTELVWKVNLSKADNDPGTVVRLSPPPPAGGPSCHAS
jgi:hypothetical protein